MDALHRLKVAVVAPSAPPFGGGGVASSHYHLYRCLLQADCETTLLTFNETETRAIEPGILRYGASRRIRSFLELGVFFYLKTIGSRRPAYQLTDIINSIPGVLKMNRTIRRLRPDLIIIPDHGAPGLFLDKQNAKLLMVAHHNPSRFIENPMLGDYCPIDVSTAINLEKRVLNRVDAVICPSRYMATSFCETYDFPGKIAVIPNPVDLSLIDSIPVRDIRQEMGVHRTVPVVYIPSAGSKLKGERFVFEIVRRLSKTYNAEIAFYLSGSVTASLQEELRHLPGNARLFMPGHLGYSDNLSIVKSCSFGVSPTLIESFGMAILEANFCGLPMVVFDVGGTGEIVVHGENGFCVPYLDLDALVGAAERLLNPEVRDLMRLSSSVSVKQRFDSRASTEQYLAL